MVKLVDAADSKSAGGNLMRVQVPPSASHHPGAAYCCPALFHDFYISVLVQADSDLFFLSRQSYYIIKQNFFCEHDRSGHLFID